MEEEMNGWDVEVNDTEVSENGKGGGDGFIVLPSGTYKFTINKVEHKNYQPAAGKSGGINKPCKQIKLGIIIDGGALGKSWADDNLFAWHSCMFRTLSVLKSIGEIKDGFVGKPSDHFDALKGGEGVCEIETESYVSKKDGQTYQKNVIKKYYKPTEKFTLSSGSAQEDF